MTYEEQQRRTEHHDYFHKLPANQASMFASAKNTIENKSYGAKGRAACENKSDEAEQSKLAAPGDHVSHEVIEEFTRMGNQVQRDSSHALERRPLRPPLLARGSVPLFSHGL
jgi:hypothetical protein